MLRDISHFFFLLLLGEHHVHDLKNVDVDLKNVDVDVIPSSPTRHREVWINVKKEVPQAESVSIKLTQHE